MRDCLDTHLSTAWHSYTHDLQTPCRHRPAIGAAGDGRCTCARPLYSERAAVCRRRHLWRTRRPRHVLPRVAQRRERAPAADGLARAQARADSPQPGAPHDDGIARVASCSHCTLNTEPPLLPLQLPARPRGPLPTLSAAAAAAAARALCAAARVQPRHGAATDARSRVRLARARPLGVQYVCIQHMYRTLCTRL